MKYSINIMRKTGKLTPVVLLFALLLLNACGNKKAEQRAESIKEQGLAVPENVSIVSAIGKIEPKGGLVEIASEYGGIITQLFKAEGDYVEVGEIIFELNTESEKADENILLKQLDMQQKRAEADYSNIQQYEIQLAEIERDLDVSNRLAETGAETWQNVDTKKKDRDVVRANLNSARKNAAASFADIDVIKSQLEKSKKSTNARLVRAEQSGTLISMNLKEGSSIAPLAPFATLSPSEKYIVHGEIDEMFANRVKVGNKVSIKIPGTNQEITEATIDYLSPVLEDKSMFYGKAGEQADRRVRRFKATLINQSGVLINQKVECTINL